MNAIRARRGRIPIVFCSQSMSEPSAQSPATPHDGGGFKAACARHFRRIFTPRSVPPEQLPGIMVKHIYTGAMANVWATLIAGVFLVYFGNRIGITKFEWGIMSALGSWMLLTEVMSAGLTKQIGHRKLLWFLCVFADRGLRFDGILTALLLWRFGMPHAGVALIIFTAAATFLGAMANPPWFSWLADLIPEKQHGEFWGRRSAWISVAILCTLLPAALCIDRLPENLKLPVIICFFAIGTVLGFLDFFIHSTIPEPPMARLKDPGHRRHMMTPLHDREFRPFLVFSFCWTFATMIGAALFTVFILKDLGGDRNLFGTACATAGSYLVAATLTAKWTGTLIDRAGAKAVMRWGYISLAALPAAWFFFTPGNVLWVCGILNLVGGFSGSAAQNAFIQIQTRFPPAAHRAMYIAVSNCANYIAAGFAGLAAAFLAYWLEDWNWTPLGMRFGLLDVLAAVSLILRLHAALFLINPIRERSAAVAAAA